MAETLQNLSDAQMIAEHVARTLLSAAQYPEFPPGNVPVSVAQKVFGKSGTWVRKRAICIQDIRTLWDASQSSRKSLYTRAADKDL